MNSCRSTQLIQYELLKIHRESTGYKKNTNLTQEKVTITPIRHRMAKPQPIFVIRSSAFTSFFES